MASLEKLSRAKLKVYGSILVISVTLQALIFVVISILAFRNGDVGGWGSSTDKAHLVVTGMVFFALILSLVMGPGV